MFLPANIRDSKHIKQVASVLAEVKGKTTAHAHQPFFHAHDACLPPTQRHDTAGQLAFLRGFDLLNQMPDPTHKATACSWPTKVKQVSIVEDSR